MIENESDPLVSVSIKLKHSQREISKSWNLSRTVRCLIESGIEISEAVAPEKWAGVKYYIDSEDYRVWVMVDGSLVIPTVIPTAE